MSFIAVAIGAGALISGATGLIGAGEQSSATESAANTQAQSAAQAQALQKQEFDQQQQNISPFLAAGRNALPQLQSMAQNPTNFSMADFQADPGYNFSLQQGNQAIQRSAAAQGGLMSGGTLKALSAYNTGQASNEYQNAYSRFTNNQNNQFNRLASLANVGQTGASQLGQAGQNFANNTANEVTGNANAQAGATVAQGQIWGNTLSSLGNNVGSSVSAYPFLRSMSAGGGYGGAGAMPGAGSSGFTPSAPLSYNSSAFGQLGGT